VFLPLSSWRGQPSHLNRTARRRATHSARAKPWVPIARSCKVPNLSACETGAQAAARGAVFSGTMR